ncbi:carbon monoxide dehydrogenase [Metarhizobium album]|uniref:Carbon monoxide dehydrogenase n=1 Tax=Metarhizobium album TaxID=2182425 RepID=A0A2U2DLS7_9HYPH|nr:MHYT domain-containing protein [Rhizobium album]PWE54231.1 carbon monoxide dehydrogenase [Rhizobium album]
MFAGHDPFLVALSVAVAVLGGYTGFGLAARIRVIPTASRRLLLTGAAAFLAVGIWTMHFIGMLAAPIPLDGAYLVLPTFVSFLICALVVGISLFFVSIGEPSTARVLASAVLLGVGIILMHYVGIHGLQGHFVIVHDDRMIALSVVVALCSAYGGLRIYLARQGGLRLALSALAFGIAVSGMHYTAMYGMHFEVPAGGQPMQHHAMAGGLVASSQVLAIIVAFLCFLIAAGFLLFLVPEARPRLPSAGLGFPAMAPPALTAGEGEGSVSALPTEREKTVRPAVAKIPVEGADGTHFVDAVDVRSVRADAHYTLIHDGCRDRMCPWSISEAEAQLSPATFMRVHRSHIVALPHISFIRKEGDGAVVELDGQAPHVVPVSRAKIAELKSRLGLARKGATATADREMGHPS